MRKMAALLAFALVAPALHAETAYVTERLPIALHAAFAEDSPVVKVIQSGASVEVLERAERYARVREPQGEEGWIEARFLTSVPPARLQLDRLQTELGRTQQTLAQAQARVKELEGRLAQESERSAQAMTAVERVEASPSPPPAPVPSGGFDSSSWGWLALAFAMLWIGFGAGVVWLRERHRKKLGGMYLRI